MDPASLAIASLAATAVSAGVGTAAAISSSQASAASSKYQAAVARNNQIIANQNATRQEAAGRAQAQNQDFKTRAVVGATEAAQGASGIDAGTGSPADVRTSEQQIGRLDALTLMDNAQQNVRASQIEATGFGSQAALDRTAATNATTAGSVQAFSSILGGASSFADKWLKYKNQGVDLGI